MPFPTKVKFLGYTYGVKIGTDETSTAGARGLFDGDKQMIHIHTHNQLDARVEALLHEILHMIDYHMDTELEETQIHRMSHGLYGVLRDNPLLLRQLQEENGSGRKRARTTK